jgi:Arc/MetJ family transcription regulator
MRITIELDAGEVKKIQKITGQKKKSPAIAQALSEFLRERERQKFIQRALAGETDYALTNDELEARDVYETRR